MYIVSLFFLLVIHTTCLPVGQVTCPQWWACQSNRNQWTCKYTLINKFSTFDTNYDVCPNIVTLIYIQQHSRIQFYQIPSLLLGVLILKKVYCIVCFGSQCCHGSLCTLSCWIPSTRKYSTSTTSHTEQ